MIRLNPVYRKELKQTARMKKVMILLLVFNSLLALFGLFAFYLTFEGAKKAGNVVDYADILMIYAVITAIEFVLILVLTPGLTAGAISSEREKQTLDILLSTAISPGAVIRGKLLASIHFMQLLVFSSLPVIGIVFAVGGITVWGIIRLLLLYVVTAIYIGSIGIFFSCFCKRSTIATVCTYTTLLILIVGFAILLLGEQVMGYLFKTDIMQYRVDPYTIDANDSFLFLLINPIFTYASMLFEQIGIGIGNFGRWKTTHQLTYYIFQHWYYVSIIIQLLISGLLLWVSGRIITKHRPMFKKRQFPT